MQLSLSQDELLQYTRSQLNTFFPDKYDFIGDDVDRAFNLALDRSEECFGAICHPGYHNADGDVQFSHLHADQYAAYLYFLANSLWKDSNNTVLCSKLLQLNRVLNSLFISYKCDMPDHFMLGHPLGTILGNADYGDYMVVFQGVTVNTETDDEGNAAPKFGKGVFLGAGAKVIGNKPIGDRVSIGVDAFVFDQEIPSDSVVIHTHDNSGLVRPRKGEICQAQKYFNVEL